MNDLEKFVVENGMEINTLKSKVMKFSRSAKPLSTKVSFRDNKNLEEIQQIKLLGLQISENLKWDSNTSFICKNARRKIFLLRNMKNSGLSQSELIDAYKKEVRSLLELAVPVWNSGLTQEQSLFIERVQKSALAAILGPKYRSYEDALQLTNLDRLSIRREQMCLKFINKNLKSDNPLLKLVNKSYNTRSDTRSVEEFQCRTKSYFQSGLPYLARLYNASLKSK